jgi:AraC-like DNA-binding protein
MLYNFDALSFEILSIFRLRHENGSFSVKPRPYAALAFRLHGRGEFNIGGNREAFSAGDIIFLPADMPYKVKYSDSEMIVVHLMHCNYREAEIFHPENSALFRPAFLRLLEEWNENHSVNSAKSKIYDILEKMAGEKRKDLGGGPFDACLSYMEAHFCDPNLGIGEICAVGFMSQSSLQRGFHERFGMSPKAYLSKLRLHRATELLLSGHPSVKEVAFACGFSDEKFFSRVFKEKYGFSPSQLKKE